MFEIKKEWVRIISEAMFFFGLICWIYVVAMQIARPESMHWTTTEWFRLRLDHFGQLSFFVSIAGFLIMRYLKKNNR